MSPLSSCAEGSLPTTRPDRLPPPITVEMARVGRERTRWRPRPPTKGRNRVAAHPPPNWRARLGIWALALALVNAWPRRRCTPPSPAIGQYGEPRVSQEPLQPQNHHSKQPSKH